MRKIVLLTILVWAGFLGPGYAEQAAAVSAEWSLQNAAPLRERVVLRLDASAAGTPGFAPSSIVRNGLQSVEMIWPAQASGSATPAVGAAPATGTEIEASAATTETGGASTGGLIVPAPANAALFNGIVPGKRGLLLLLKDPAFGFVVTKPQADLIQIDLFQNPLGARWKTPDEPEKQIVKPVKPVTEPAKSEAESAGNQADASSANQTDAPDVTPVAEPNKSTEPPAQSGSIIPSEPPVPPTVTPGSAGTQIGAPLPPGQFLAPPAADVNIVQDADNGQSPGNTNSIEFPALPSGVLNPVMAGQTEAPAVQDTAAAQMPANSIGSAESAGQTGQAAQAAVPAGTPPAAMTEEGALQVLDNPPLYPQLEPEPPLTSGNTGTATELSTATPAATPNVTPDVTSNAATTTPVEAPDVTINAPTATPALTPGTAPNTLTPPVASQVPEQATSPVPTQVQVQVPATVFNAVPAQTGQPVQTSQPGQTTQPGQPSHVEDEAEEFLEWPPMVMPESLPPAPPPPLYNPESGTPAGAAGAAPGASLLKKLWPFAADLAYAAEVTEEADGSADAQADAAAGATAGAAYEAIDAPFIYRSKLVREGEKPDPAVARVPVYVNVPAASITASERGAVQEAGQDIGTGTGQEGAGQTDTQIAGPPAESSTRQTTEASPELPATQPATQTGGQAVIPPTTMPAGQTGENVPAETISSETTPAETATATTTAPATVNVQTETAPADASGQKEQAEQVGQTGQAEQASQTEQAGTTGQTEKAGAGAATESAPAATTEPAATAPAAQGKPVVYVDEQGNPVEPPLDPQQAGIQLEQHMSAGEFPEAYEIADKLSRQNNLDNKQREYVLHRRADAMYSMHRDDPAAFFNEVMDTTTAAINFNTRSPRNAEAYLRLGFLNLKANNAYEAEAYFTVLRQQYPRDEAVPLSYYYMGDYQYSQGNLNDAVLQFVHVVQEYPDSRYSRDSALGLTRTLYRLGYYDKAYEVIDYVEKRWPRYYLDYPPVLSVLGDTAYRARQIDRARQAYLLYYNLQPNAEDADIILSRIGDIYQSQKYRSAATHVYEEAVRRFPGKEGGIIAMMRLAENGINDDPTMAGMFKVFQQPYNLVPAEAYRKIIRDYPDSPLVTLAKLKLAIWSVWQKDFESAFKLCNEIVMADPDHPLALRAIDVSRNAFALLAAESVNSKRYERVRDAWERYPLLHTQEEFLDPESRLALAVSEWEGDKPDAALDTIEPFFLGEKLPEYSEMALILGLTILVEYDRWQAVEDLADRVELWEITPETKRQMDYALGLAYENQGKGEEAMPIWKNLYEQNALPPEQQAYADYFLARQSESDNDLESAYRIGQDALQRLKDLAALNPEQADTEKIQTMLGSLMNIAQTSGLLQNALDYGKEYLTYASPGSDDYLSVMYNLAALHRQRGSMGEWEKILIDLSENYPETHYGKAAASQLSAYRMNRDASQFSPN